MPGRNHSNEFKRDILQQVEEGSKSKAQICREYDLSPSLIYRWQQQQSKDGEHAFDAHNPSELHSLERRVAELERLLGQSHAENVYLKNVLAAHRKKTGGK